MSVSIDLNALIKTDRSTHGWPKYYFFGSQRIAMKRGTVLTYLDNDHLGSPVLTTSGTISATQTYQAYGKVRSYSGSYPTLYQFTGQYVDDSALAGM